MKQKEHKQSAKHKKEVEKKVQKEVKKALEEGADKDNEESTKTAEDGDGGEAKEADVEGGDEEVVAPVDINLVDNINDIGEGEPLFAHFMFEDWALMSLRLELHLLTIAFRRDVNDPERPGIHENHLSFYYSKYYKKQLNTKFFGMANTSELVEMIKDTVKFSTDDKILNTILTEDIEKDFNIFVKLTEECRRERQRRIDAGDETAKLRFSVLAASSPQPKSSTASSSLAATAKSSQGGQPWQAGQKWQPRAPLHAPWAAGYRPTGGQSWRQPQSRGW